MVPQYLASEIGLALCLAGFALLAREWFHVYRSQGNALARDDLLVYLREWRAATDDATRGANVRRMRATLPELKHNHRKLYSGYIDSLEQLSPDDDKGLAALALAFAVGTPLEDKERRRPRARLMVTAVILVAFGTLGQMVGSFADPGRLGLCTPLPGQLWCP